MTSQIQYSVILRTKRVRTKIRPNNTVKQARIAGIPHLKA